MKKCLFVNPVSNGKNLATYFKNKGVDIFILIEVDKVRNWSGGEISQKKSDQVEHTFYNQCFLTVDEVLASKIKFDCIIPGSECGVDTAEFLAKKLELKGNNPATTDFRRNKFVMQEQLKLNNLSYAKSLLIDLKLENILTKERLKDFSFPLILKPVNSAGMEDVFVCDTLKELTTRLKQLNPEKINCTWVENRYFVVQEYLKGEEFALDFVVYENIPYICVISKYIKDFKVNNKFIASKSIFLNPNDKKYNSLITYAKEVLKALEVTNSPAHLEFISDGERHCLIDIGARMRGGIASYFYDNVYTIGVQSAIYDTYVNNGKNLKNAILEKQCICLSFASSKEGIFSGLTASEKEALSKLSLIKEFKINLKEGEYYKKTTDLLSMKGEAIVIGNNISEVKKTVYDICVVLESHFGDWYKKIVMEIHPEIG